MWRSSLRIGRTTTSWDRVVKGTHTYANCTAACAFDLCVKGGIVWREEQETHYPDNHPRHDFNPRG
ncbi:MAG: hypothetical protein HYY20_02035 [Candidatus Tectomicrobia bacterium]|uniref:4Fe-4S Mo/W bis-MGD-type domain-containing protein n=1 Tax=Tectimicrobiota bacterium TaxID=2528274 RepID=A0A932CM18_UNCTE|nr:hypothetical protein [Candidatus Tectomicrobia bacterium]